MLHMRSCWWPCEEAPGMMGMGQQEALQVLQASKA